MHLLKPMRLLVWLLLLATAGVAVAQSGANARIRFVHVIPEASAVDVYVNGSLAVRNLDYGEATTYITAPAGQHLVTAAPSGISAPLWQQSITLAAGDVTTFIAASQTNLAFVPYTDDLQALPFGSARLLLIHAIADGPGVDAQLAEPVIINGESIQNAGTPLGTGLTFGTALGTFDIPAATYNVAVLPTGGSPLNAILPNVPLGLAAGTSNIAVVYGTPEQPQALLLSTPTQAAADNGFVRFVHGVRSAPAVDVYINNTLMVPGLTPVQPTPHIGLPAGNHSVVLRAAGTTDDLLTTSLNVSTGVAQTVAALPDESGVAARTFVDDISAMTETNVTVSVINAVPDSTVTITLPNGTSLASGLAFGQASAPARFAPASQSPNVTLNLGDQSGAIPADTIQFYGGVYYNVFLLAGTGLFSPPELVVAPTSLSQTLASVPGAGLTIATGGDTGPATAPNNSEVVFAPTDPTPAPVDSEVVPAATTPAPQPQAPAVVETAPPRTASADQVTARVLVDPDANLQLRLRPDANEQSLGLAPSGTTLIVNGREGRPVALVDGQAPPPEAATFVDPATQLIDERDDLNPETTWLNVTYTTPDGGEITAWANALFLDVRDPDGAQQRLADLPTIAGNIPGFTSSTEVTPPPPPEDRITAEVINLNPGVGLNVRRNPDANSERLTGLLNGTVVDLEGLNPTEDWAFITFRPADGGTITGWVSTQYLTYSLNGRDATIDELAFARSRATNNLLLVTIPEDRVGLVSSDAAVAAPPTPDPLEDAFVAEVVLNPGANLQFRREPDRNSESIGLIPSGTRLIVEGRNSAGDWLRAEFEGETGWIAAQFVVLSFNGEFVEIEDVPLLSGL